MEQEIIKIQIAWFFSVNFEKSFETVSMTIKAILGESKVTQYLPIPNSAPSELPRVILQYDKFAINISKNRLDLFFKNSEDVKESIKKITGILISNLSIFINRLGFVKSIFVEGSITDISKLLVNQGVSGADLKRLNIGIGIEKKIDNCVCNSAENIINAVIEKKDNSVSGSIKKSGIIITRDINTLENGTGNAILSVEVIERLIAAFNGESETYILWQK